MSTLVHFVLTGVAASLSGATMTSAAVHITDNNRQINDIRVCLVKSPLLLLVNRQIDEKIERITIKFIFRRLLLI